MVRRVWIGYDPNEADAFAVAKHSMRRHRSGACLPVHGLVLSRLRARGLYRRPTEIVDGRLWDSISGAHMSTEFAVSRFLVPELERRGGSLHGKDDWALFVDCDILVRADVFRLFDECDESKAVMVVKHAQAETGREKMGGQIQDYYSPRKNWSSVCAFNLNHPANEALDVELVNSVPGRDLHAFCWLADDQIGALDPAWNYLIGVSPRCAAPKIAHFTLGIPRLAQYRDCEYADEWQAELERWAE